MAMEQLIGLSVAQALRLCGKTFADIAFIDEPPGRLRAIELECGGASRLTLEIAGDSAPFSSERDWPEAEVLQMKVVRVVGDGLP
jgi:hypothetical protein